MLNLLLFTIPKESINGLLTFAIIFTVVSIFCIHLTHNAFFAFLAVLGGIATFYLTVLGMCS